MSFRLNAIISIMFAHILSEHACKRLALCASLLRQVNLVGNRL